MAAEPKLTLPALRAMTDRGEIDTIVLAAPDMQGRLQGKRVMPKFFFDSVTADSAEGCAYLLATDIECSPVPGYALTRRLLPRPGGPLRGQSAASSASGSAPPRPSGTPRPPPAAPGAAGAEYRAAA